MKHRTDCHGCGIWKDKRGVEWQACRMTLTHLRNTRRHLMANRGRWAWDDLVSYGAVSVELNRRRKHEAESLSA